MPYVLYITKKFNSIVGRLVMIKRHYQQFRLYCTFKNTVYQARWKNYFWV